MSDFVYRPSAVADVGAAYQWYETQRPGLGDEFLDELREAERRIGRSPGGFRLIYRGVRRHLLRRFPYQLLYRTMDETIVVLGCLHVRRAPGIARDGPIANYVLQRTPLRSAAETTIRYGHLLAELG